MTDQQPNLDTIEARADAATPGPWCTDSWEIYQGANYEPGLSLWIGETCRGTTSLEQDRADAAFVAAARTDVPALVAEVRRLRDQLEDQADADTVADRAARAISAMGADLRAMTSERNRYRNAWHNARARAADAEDNTKFTEEQQPAAPAARSAAV